MRTVLILVVSCTVALIPCRVSGASTSTNYPISLNVFAPNETYIDIKSATPSSIAGLGELIAATLGSDGAFKTTLNLADPNTYVLVHLIRWSNPSLPVGASTTAVATAEIAAAAAQADLLAASKAVAGGETPDNKAALQNALAKDAHAQAALAAAKQAAIANAQSQQTVQFSRWFVYNKQPTWSLDDFEKNNRVFGAVHVWLLSVHLNINADKNAADRLQTYRPIYRVTSVKKTAAPLQHFGELAKLFPGVPQGGAPGGRAPGSGPGPFSAWGGAQITVDNPSDVTIAPTLAADDTGSNSVPLGDETKFDNEGRYWFDFGIAIPIRAASDLSADAAGVVTAKTITKANAFATFDVFFKPVDVKTPGLRPVPHLVAGMSITGNPLNAFFVGIGWGPAIANVYGGWLRTKLAVPSASGHTHDDQFTFGIELQVADALINKLSK